MLKQETSGANDLVQGMSRLPSPVDGIIRVRESLLNWLSGAGPEQVINSDWPDVALSPSADLAARLKETLDDLKRLAMNDEGTMVDYAAIYRTPAYEAYQAECLAALRRFKPQALPTKAAQQAFWINLYNALVLDAVITTGVKQSVTEGRLGMMAFFRRSAYLVDGNRVSLEDIEHGILRGNRGNPYVLGAHFASADPRLAWSLPLDPRIHFTLNCGGRSCPPIRSYAPDKVDNQLELAARSFLNGTVEIDFDKGQLRLSKILRWYQADFGGRQGLLDFLIDHLPDDERREYLLQARDKVRFTYIPYDWSLNTLRSG